MFPLKCNHMAAICLFSVFLSARATSLKCYDCGALSEEQMDEAIGGLMDSLMENNASALESFDGQFPDDCPSKITDTADYACAAEEFCVKVTASAIVDITLTVDGETMSMQNTVEGDRGDAMRTCDRAYGPETDVTIESGKCYAFTKTYENDVGYFKVIGAACYCNDTDYCNGASRFPFSFLLVIPCYVLSMLY